jgi:hypothetical protein
MNLKDWINWFNKIKPVGSFDLQIKTKMDPETPDFFI